MIRTVGFLQKLSKIDDVTQYHGIPVSRYFIRRYIIVGHFFIPRIPREDLWMQQSHHMEKTDAGLKGLYPRNNSKMTDNTII